MLKHITFSKNTSRHGFTVLETLIFLAVTGILALAAVRMISGQIGKTKFQQSVREFETELRDLANDVATGNPNLALPEGKACRLDSSNQPEWPDATVVNDRNDIRPRCIYIGRVVEFGAPGTDRLGYRVYSVVGKQRTDKGTEVGSLEEAKPKVLTDDGGGTSLIKESSVGGGGAEVFEVVSKDSNGSIRVAALGFFTTFQSSYEDKLSSGGIRTDVVPITFLPNFENAETNVKSQVESELVGPRSLTHPPFINPSGGITICLKSPSSDQHAYIYLGTRGTSSTITADTTPTTGALTITSVIEAGDGC